jgi:hypothetical protein
MNSESARRCLRDTEQREEHSRLRNQDKGIKTQASKSKLEHRIEWGWNDKTSDGEIAASKGEKKGSRR